MSDEEKTASEDQPSESESNTLKLSEVEARVLGSLMEKQLTTPDQYPLTLNSLVLACNQKTSREPVTNHSKGDVENCVNNLRDKKLIEVEYGSRASRYDQRLSRALFLEKPMQALLTIMLLRGPQTINELISRTDRMYRFENPKAVEELLSTYCQKTSPIVIHIPRQSGQREDRYMHLLCGQPDLSKLASLSSARIERSENNQELLDRIEALERKLTKVMNALDISEDE